MKITILGCGAYGLALATQFLKQPENEVTIYTKFEEEKKEVDLLHRRESILKGVELPPLFITLSLKEALENTSYVVFAVPFFALEETIQEIKPFIEEKMTFVFASKGLRKEDGATGPEIYSKMGLSNPFIVLSGPTFAKDLANSEEVILTFASTEEKILSPFARCFPKNVAIEFSSDVIGVSYCGALKNIFAILHGYLVGKGVSVSTQASVLYKSIHTIEFFLEIMNCQRETILTAAGVGDFYMTAESMESRNHTFGYLLATESHEHIDLYLKKTTVEGVHTLDSCCNLLKRKALLEKMPIFSILQDLIQGKTCNLQIILEALYR